MSVPEKTGAQLLAAGLWQVDPVHSLSSFRVGHMMIATDKGRFRDLDCAIDASEVPGARALGTGGMPVRRRVDLALDISAVRAA